MATTGYSDLKEFQRVEVVVAPYQRRLTGSAADLEPVGRLHLGMGGQGWVVQEGGAATLAACPT